MDLRLDSQLDSALNSRLDSPLDLPIKTKWLANLAYSATGLGTLRGLYNRWGSVVKTKSSSLGEQLLDFALDDLSISANFENQHNLEHIPKMGSLIVVANHPLGGLEGMLLARLLLKIRPDVKVLTNELLLKIPEFSDLFVGVDVLNDGMAQANSKGIRQIFKHLSGQGALLIFPAGRVSELNLKTQSIEDPHWDPIVGRLVQKYHAACTPIYIDSKNEMSFYLSGLIHKRLRTALLPRAMISKQGKPIKIIIGKTIPYTDMKQIKSAQQINKFLRVCTEFLRKSEPTGTDVNHSNNVATSHKEIKADVETNQINQQLLKLEKYSLIEQSQYKVYCAPYNELGCLMEQIAISRETTFRQVDEGTGKELDNDQYDPYYWHLWIWDKQENKIVGGYRLGKTDQIIKNHGIEKLYSSTLYKYSESFTHKLGKSIEVGRSFIAPEYQKNPRLLDLLWRGIGSFLTANPQYHTLFGGVSVSKQYSPLARAFLADSLLNNFSAETEYRKAVTPLSPLKIKDKPWSLNLIAQLSDVPIINKLLGRIDSGKNIPVLIRHYLALNGRFISFSINRNFNDSLDGLLVVDLRLTPEKYLKRYLGQDGAKKFNTLWNNYEQTH